MSLPADQTPANVPPARPAPPAAPAPGGLGRTLKIAIPVVVGMAVIFGFAFFSQYSPTDPKEGDDPVRGNEPPLRFFSAERHWDPDGSLQERAFPGFYERQASAAGTPNGAAFWFENRNPKPVRMQVKGVSCSACSGARLAPIPPAVTRDILQMTAVSALPGGLFSGLPLGLAGPAAGLADATPERRGYGLEWQGYAFKDNPKAEYAVPAADNPTGWTPQWGVLELRFSVGGGDTQKTLGAEFLTTVEGSGQAVPAAFQLSYEGVDPFNLSRELIDVGELAEDAKPREFDVLVYSSTRGPGAAAGDLDPPKVLVQMAAGGIGVPGPFVDVFPKGGPEEKPAPVRVPDADLPAVAAAVSAQLKRPVRVLSAYRFTVTVAPTVGGRRADLGPLERDVFVSYPTLGKGVRVRGSVRGGVWLDNASKEINVGNYNFAAEVATEYTVHTDDPAATLSVVPDPATPDFLQLALQKLPAAADRGSYKLLVTVPANRKSGPWAGFVVLEVKGAKPQRIRIPVKGNGTTQ
ncbi:MAG: hypothetical protein C0501_19960 [Isosphaera sp.]|nr:hypothetical protein [Isosphaera sp.]